MKLLGKTTLATMLASVAFGNPLFAEKPEIIKMRGAIPNTMRRITADRQATIGFLGGSITEMKGYVDFTQEALKKRFPECKFKFVRAGLSSTCSDTGAFRVGKDILKKAPDIDLLFIEFAVNDNQDGHFAAEHSIRGIEGIVRQVKKCNPQSEIVLLYSANESHLEHYHRKVTPHEISAHESVARRYRLASINFAAQVSDEIDRKKYDWEKFGGVHPAAFGCRIYATWIDRFFACAEPGETVVTYPDVPEIDPFSYSNGRIIKSDAAKFDDLWSYSIPDWEKIPGKKRSCYTGKKILHSTAPGATLTLDFTGRAIGFLTTAGDDAGILEFSIDGAPFKTVDTYRSDYSKILHYPYTVMLADELDDGKHTLTLRIAQKHNEASCGNAIRIFGFTAN
ncbi:MAG: GDSL-type esterase/lipase family protein [Victivallaceae bacterium]|nr:GDSL-type esterase/lipase family protein [Victivallaceae bacterium]